MQHDFNQLERDVLAWIREHDPAKGLAAQIDKAVFRRREYTGVGFYVDFDVPEDTPGLEPFAGPIDGPSIISSSLEAGAGTLLWHEDGRASCLEIFAYGDLFPEDLPDYRLERPCITRASNGRGQPVGGRDDGKR